jgi:peroxiredoxin
MIERRSFLLAGTGLAAALAGAGAAWWRLAPGPAADDAVATLFGTTLPDANGTPQPLAQWRGQVLVVNFWATWCPPCVEEMPDLQRVREAYRHRRVEIVGIGIDNAGKIREFRDRLQLTLPLLVAGVEGSQLARDLGNVAGVLPFTVLIDPAGQVVQRKVGQIKPAELTAWLDAQLA